MELQPRFSPKSENFHSKSIFSYIFWASFLIFGRKVVHSIPKRSRVSEFSFRSSFLSKKFLNFKFFKIFTRVKILKFKIFFLKNEDLNENSESWDLLGMLWTTFLPEIRKLAQKLKKIDFFWNFSLFWEKYSTAPCT